MNNIELKKRIARDYFIMFFLLAVSAIPYFSSNTPFTICFAVILTVLFLTDKNQVIDKGFFYILFVALLCVFFQSLIFSYFKLITILGFILKILTAYFAIKLLNENFINYFLRVMIFFSVVSLIIFIPILIHPGLLDTLINATPSFLSYQYELWGFQVNHKTLIFYNLSKEVDRLRNCGPFWEPGAFGGFLTIGLVFNTIRENKLLVKINSLFIITIITTQSTTAYLALFIFIMCYLLFQNYSKIAKLLVVFVAIGGIVAYQTIPFLGEKIKVEKDDTENSIEDKGGDARIASAILDWNDIKGYPFSGRGLWPETRVDKKFEFVMRNNGLTNFLAEWGFLFFFLYFFYYYQGFYIYCKLNHANRYMPLVLLAIFFLISFSEDYFDLQFFWALTFLHIPLKKYYTKTVNTQLFETNSIKDK